MKEFQYRIQDANGVHARPAGLLVKEASKFNSIIEILCGDKTADAKKIFSVMSLGIKQNDTVTVRIDGDDEAKAMPHMENFFKNNL